MFEETTVNTDSNLPAFLVIYKPETVRIEKKYEDNEKFLQRQVLPDHDAHPVVRVWDGVRALEQIQGLGDWLVRVVGGVQQPVDVLQLVRARDAIGQVQLPLPVQLGGRRLGRHLRLRSLLLYHFILFMRNVLEGLGRLTGIKSQ